MTWTPSTQDATTWVDTTPDATTWTDAEALTPTVFTEV